MQLLLVTDSETSAFIDKTRSHDVAKNLEEAQQWMKEKEQIREKSIIVVDLDMPALSQTAWPWNNPSHLHIALSESREKLHQAMTLGASRAVHREENWKVFLATAIDKSVVELGRQKHHEHLKQALDRLEKQQGLSMIYGGITHDFNNLLSIILGNSRLLREDKSLPETLQGQVDHIIETCRHGRSMTKQLMLFHRDETHVPITDLSQTIRRVGSLLQKSLSGSIKLSMDLSPVPLHVEVPPSEIIRIVMNLTFNARDAMPQGGRIKIRSRHENGRVILEVEDNGCGMDEYTRNRIFDAFYTTKEDKGTGLGLTSVRNLVESRGGQVSLESAPEEGSCFKVSYPSLK